MQGSSRAKSSMEQKFYILAKAKTALKSVCNNISTFGTESLSLPGVDEALRKSIILKIWKCGIYHATTPRKWRAPY